MRRWRLGWWGKRRGATRAGLVGQGFFAKAMTRATGRDGGDVDRTGAEGVFGGCL
ncbi:MAG: hypothetical protein LBB09_01750 [Rickettsiales bacterium]|nr:hypothetical protein [Rickettsiales bacterium]